MDPLIHKTTMWFRCLVCHGFYLTKNEFIFHRTKSECRFKYKKIHRERSIRITSPSPGSGLAPETLKELQKPELDSDKAIESTSGDSSNCQPEKQLQNNSNSKEPIPTEFSCYFCPSRSTSTVYETFENLNLHMQCHTLERQNESNPIKPIKLGSDHETPKTPQDSKEQLASQNPGVYSEKVIPSNSGDNCQPDNPPTESNNPSLREQSISTGYFCHFCPSASTGYETFEDLNLHMQCHTFEVERQNEQLSNISNPAQTTLGSNHERPDFSTSELKKFKCKLCPKRYTSRGALHMHTSSIHKGVKYPCKICSKPFSHPSNLKTHVLTVHEGTRSFLCKIPGCSKSYASGQNLKLHVSSVHNGQNLDEKTSSSTFKCKLCPKRYRSQGALHMHTSSIHKGVKYPCEMCSNAFSQLGNLKTHVSAVHEGRTYPCQMCAKTFSQPGNLKTHVSVIHEGLRRGAIGRSALKVTSN